MFLQSRTSGERQWRFVADKVQTRDIVKTHHTQLESNNKLQRQNGSRKIQELRGAGEQSHE